MGTMCSTGASVNILPFLKEGNEVPQNWSPSPPRFCHFLRLTLPLALITISTSRSQLVQESPNCQDIQALPSWAPVY